MDYLGLYTFPNCYCHVHLRKLLGLRHHTKCEMSRIWHQRKESFSLKHIYTANEKYLLCTRQKKKFINWHVSIEIIKMKAFMTETVWSPHSIIFPIYFNMCLFQGIWCYVCVTFHPLLINQRQMIVFSTSHLETYMPYLLYPYH